MEVNEELVCRVCKGNLKVSLDLGKIYPSSFIPKNIVLSEEDKAPLVLAECEKCGLVQLKHTVDLDSMYRQYWYASSLNKSMVSSLREIIASIENRLYLEDKDIVVDIGANDCTMLDLYSNKNLVKVGFDPALNLKRSNNCIFINDYFSADNYPKNLQKAKVVTAIAMFYDLPDPNEFVNDVKHILADDGIFVIQLTDLLSMIKINAFDNICSEHLEFYRLKDIINLLNNNGLRVINVSYNNVNGGSVRVVASHIDSIYDTSSSVSKYKIEEDEYLKNNGINNIERAVNTTKNKLQEFLKNNKDKKIYLLGASTKGNTLLQLCNITKEQILYVAEVNKEKFGLKTVGTDIDIISDEQALNDNPDIFIILPWHFIDFFVSKYSDYLKKGGKFLVPLPEPKMITKYGTEYI